jgi:hypothetical protein
VERDRSLHDSPRHRVNTGGDTNLPHARPALPQRTCPS